MSSVAPTTLGIAGLSVVATFLSGTSGSSGGVPHTSTSSGTMSSPVPTTLPVSASLSSAITTSAEGVPLVGGSAAGPSMLAMPLG